MRTLSPSGRRGREGSQLGRCGHHGATAEVVRARVDEALERIADEVALNFPDNIFLDLDALSCEMLGGGARRGPDAVAEYAAVLVDLLRTYGRHGRIQFRYIHDLTYGFDWAKWVARDPARRAPVRPFQLEFLFALRARGRELLALIDADDPEYPSLPPHTARNPFVFSREPTDETMLLESLAGDGLLPVQAWTCAPEPRWDLPFAELRCRRATELGLPQNRPRVDR